MGQPNLAAISNSNHITNHERLDAQELSVISQPSTPLKNYQRPPFHVRAVVKITISNRRIFVDL